MCSWSRFFALVLESIFRQEQQCSVARVVVNCTASTDAHVIVHAREEDCNHRARHVLPIFCSRVFLCELLLRPISRRILLFGAYSRPHNVLRAWSLPILQCGSFGLMLETRITSNNVSKGNLREDTGVAFVGRHRHPSLPSLLAYCSFRSSFLFPFL